MVKLKTGIKGLDELICGGIESGSRNILYGPPGTGKTVFAMQFLWQELQEGEIVAFGVMDKPFPRLRAYFKSFGWDIEPYEKAGKFIAIQAFPHFKPYQKIHKSYTSATDLDLNKAHNIFLFRFNEEKCRLELRIVKMEGCEHPLEWIPFKITNKGIEILKT